jgi:hypothetical protein
MRTLTNVELGYVSGGESPCYSLKGNGHCTPQTPGMSARQVSSAAQAASIAAQARALNSKNPRNALAWGACSLFFDAVAFVADAIAADE